MQAESKDDDENKISNNSFSLTQVLSVASIIVSLAGLYLKRKELMCFFQTSSSPKQPEDSDTGIPAVTAVADVATDVATEAKSVKIKEPSKSKINHME